MHRLLTAAAMLAIATPVTATAQAQPGPAAGAGWHGPAAGRPGGGHWNRPRWGGRTQGRWWGGWRAPGGWGAYRRPLRGWVLPSYWIAPGWYINDWRGYGLPTPPAGYNWSRYYDDAVLIDGRGSVYDTIGGVDWDRGEPADTDYDYRDDAPGGYGAGATYPAPPPEPPRDNGVGGAAIGAVVGGVAGNVIAGRGNRLGGTLVGAGVGAAAGYAIDKAEDRGRRPPPPPRGYGADYPPPPHHGHRMSPPPPGYDGGYPPPPPPPPIVTVGPGATIVSSDTRPTPGYYANGYYYPGTSITTITVQTQPAVTVREVPRSAPRRVWRKRNWHPPTKLMRRP